VARLPFPDACFDIVTSTSVLYHAWVPSVATALGEFHRVLRPGGWLFVDVPALESLTSNHDRAVMTARRFRRRELEALLLSARFSPREVAYWNVLPLPVMWAVRRLNLLGRDFDGRPPHGLKNTLMDRLMTLESRLCRVAPAPIGASLFAAAQR
jgi:SAM-dependent methyltransferase